MVVNLLSILNPIIGLTLNVIIQILSFRYISNLTLLRSIVLGFVFGLFLLFASEIYIFKASSIKDCLSLFIVNLITYVSLGYGYFHFINLGETARRIRILREIHDSQDGLSIDEILKRYNAHNIVEMRISRLVNNGQIICKDNRYYIGKPIMLLITKTIIAMKLILFSNRNEFDSFYADGRKVLK